METSFLGSLTFLENLVISSSKFALGYEMIWFYEYEFYEFYMND